MIVLVGKTCSGKSTIAKILHDKYKFRRVVTYTTRPPREGEQDGVEYNFTPPEKFEELKAADFFFETTSYNVASGETWYYGTSKESLDDNAVLVTNPEGMKKMKNLLDPDVYHLIIFYLNVSEATIWNRLRGRGDSSDEAQRRIEADKKDFEDIDKYYNYAITTDSYCAATLGLLTPEEIASLIFEIIEWELYQIS